MKQKQFKFTLRPSLRQDLDKAAAENGNSVAVEIHNRLTSSFYYTKEEFQRLDALEVLIKWIRSL